MRQQLLGEVNWTLAQRFTDGDSEAVVETAAA
jgi:hypothetical protein